jgi:hypothetical protein
MLHAFCKYCFSTAARMPPFLSDIAVALKNSITGMYSIRAKAYKLQ